MAFIEFAFDLILDAEVEFQHLEFFSDKGEDFLKAGFDLDGFEDFFFFGHWDIEVGGDEIGEVAGGFHILNDGGDFLGDVGRKLDDAQSVFLEACEEGFDLRFVFGAFFDELDASAQIRAALCVTNDAQALESLDVGEEVGGIFAHLHDAEDGSGSAHAVKLGAIGIIDFGIALPDDADDTVAGERIFDQAQAGFATDGERDHDARIDHRIA